MNKLQRPAASRVLSIFYFPFSIFFALIGSFVQKRET